MRVQSNREMHFFCFVLLYWNLCYLTTACLSTSMIASSSVSFELFSIFVMKSLICHVSISCIWVLFGPTNLGPCDPLHPSLYLLVAVFISQIPYFKSSAVLIRHTSAIQHGSPANHPLGFHHSPAHLPHLPHRSQAFSTSNPRRLSGIGICIHFFTYFWSFTMVGFFKKKSFNYI